MNKVYSVLNKNGEELNVAAADYVSAAEIAISENHAQGVHDLRIHRVKGDLLGDVSDMIIQGAHGILGRRTDKEDAWFIKSNNGHFFMSGNKMMLEPITRIKAGRSALVSKSQVKLAVDQGIAAAENAMVIEPIENVAVSEASIESTIESDALIDKPLSFLQFYTGYVLSKEEIDANGVFLANELADLYSARDNRVKLISKLRLSSIVLYALSFATQHPYLNYTVYGAAIVASLSWLTLVVRRETSASRSKKLIQDCLKKIDSLKPARHERYPAIVQWLSDADFAAYMSVVTATRLLTEGEYEMWRASFETIARAKEGSLKKQRINLALKQIYVSQPEGIEALLAS